VLRTNCGDLAKNGYPENKKNPPKRGDGQAGHPPYDTACFHVPQAIEKFLKAFLIYHDPSVPRIHDLEELKRLCLTIQLLPELDEIDLSEITDYAVEIWYDIEFWPDEQDLKESILIARKVRQIILDLIAS